MTSPIHIQALGANHLCAAPVIAPDGAAVYQPGPPMRFELREADGIRCEAAYAPFDRALMLVRVKLRIETPRTADAQGVFQVHEGAGGAGGNPVALMLLRDDSLTLTVRHNRTMQPQDKRTLNLWVGGEDGQEHEWQLLMLCGDAGRLWLHRDGVELVSYRGPLGYAQDAKPYFKTGVYRWSGQPAWDQSAPSRVVHVRDVVIG